MRVSREAMQPGSDADLGALLHGNVHSDAPNGAATSAAERVRLDGKFFRLGDAKFWVKGVTYGPFAPDRDGVCLPERHQLEADLRQIAGLGANVVRVYHVPPRSFLDDAQAYRLKVLVDVPWSKHRCFLDSREDMQGARRAVREAARGCRQHPALFALSVVNEIPSDVARWLGPARVGRFVDELADVARQEDPEALVTCASFPPTEYLRPRTLDFFTMNVYLHRREKFRSYLQRLQNLADDKPLVLGEYGIDSLRHGEGEQADLLAMHLEEVFGQGLAGTFCFSYTDEWFTGGHPITDWAFGLVRRDRSPKPAFFRVAQVFRSASPLPALPRTPKVSVVVCTYNGSKTLEGCLRSLERLQYPDYEVILVNDGSTDAVPEIARRHPSVRYHEQPNQGLSVARNVGLELATGEIVAYTDDDCFVDPDWLYFLVAKLLETGASGVGGPNLQPTNDGPVAACVSASPGTPAHILVDDTVAEHVPGCNMAFWAERLRAIGGFDAVYTKAGDDVDLCWRLQAEGDEIVFANGAMVWHHRRSTVAAYLRQQRGYGEAEGLLKRKHPEKFQGFRADLSWQGRIYTHAGLGLELGKPIISHGLFGTGLFQTLYSPPTVWWPLMVLGLEWWLLALALIGLAPVVNPIAALGVRGLAASPLLNPLLLLPLGMWALTAGVAYLVAGQASPPAQKRRFWSRLLIAAMHVAQPVERGWARYHTRFSTIEIPAFFHELRRSWQRRAGRLLARRSISLWSEDWITREKLLEGIVQLAAENRWFVRVDPGWSACDVRLYGDRWCKTDLLTATENHGSGRMLTRVRLEPAATLFQKALWVALGYGLFVMAGILAWSPLTVLPVLIGLSLYLRHSSRRLNAVAMATVLSVAERLGMTVVGAPAVLARRVTDEREEAASPDSMQEAACIIGTVSPLLARAAGLQVAARAEAHASE